jgi:AcrR family transcriptional regulator
MVRSFKERIMAYRRTERVQQRLNARHAALIAAARTLAAGQGMDAVQIAPVAELAGIAAGTVYRYFPAKTALVEALVADVSDAELAAMRSAAAAAPGPLSAFAATVVTFSARALRRRRLIWAVLSEPVDAEVDAPRLAFRRAITAEFEARLAAARDRGHLADVNPALAAPALAGALLEGLIGPLAPDAPLGHGDRPRRRAGAGAVRVARSWHRRRPRARPRRADSAAGGRSQCDMKQGTVIAASIRRVTPPRMNSRSLECP